MDGTTQGYFLSSSEQIVTDGAFVKKLLENGKRRKRQYNYQHLSERHSVLIHRGHGEWSKAHPYLERPFGRIRH
jgi:hypothetical protein